jgi:uncharacterized coiled-coil protein SlyX
MADAPAMNVRMMRVEERLTGVEGRLTLVEVRLTGVEGRLTQVEDRLTGVESRLTGVESRLTGVESKVDRLEQKVEHLDHRMGVRFDDVDGRLNQMAEQFVSLGERMERGFEQVRRDRLEDRQMFLDILGNHEGRIRGLEKAGGSSHPGA